MKKNGFLGSTLAVVAAAAVAAVLVLTPVSMTGQDAPAPGKGGPPGGGKGGPGGGGKGGPGGTLIIAKKPFISSGACMMNSRYHFITSAASSKFQSIGPAQTVSTVSPLSCVKPVPHVARPWEMPRNKP